MLKLSGKFLQIGISKYMKKDGDLFSLHFLPIITSGTYVCTDHNTYTFFFCNLLIFRHGGVVSDCVLKEMMFKQGI